MLTKVYKYGLLPPTTGAEIVNDRGVVAIDIGWRKMSDGMRVATWRGSDGDVGELELPTSISERLSKADHIRSVRDTLKNEVHMPARRLEIRDRRDT